ncbi:CD3e molecule, epsilon associated protein [Callorhinchus milii]|uniref:CD3e molecule, epsilon associated protein n=1 Tax=Callorhinchus milii TaxID=7868 RepID=UPI001C3F6940|nr:CD3e molecule, epsilon associated protein [Callorhinchus milii]
MNRKQWVVSSSEGETSEEETQVSTGQDQTTPAQETVEVDEDVGTSFPCPPDFTRCPLSRGLKRKTVADTDAELWLIRAPANFTPQSFAGKRVPLVGFQTVPTESGGKRQTYGVFGTLGGPVGARLLGAGKTQREFAGCITVAESFSDEAEGEEGEGGELHPIPPRPLPPIPEGLKQRFQPFGAHPPLPTPEKASREEEEEEEEGEGEGSKRKKKRKKKKKKKKRKRDQEEAGEAESEEVSVYTQNSLS